jgi:hypothetical protein
MSARVTIKPGLIEFWQPAEWQLIQDRIIQDHGVRMAISYVMRRELGFTVRRHRALVPNDPQHIYKDGPSMHYEEHICLDFFNDAAQSWFQLKYL